MISLRTHVVTLVAVFLALAAGIVARRGTASDVGRGRAEPRRPRHPRPARPTRRRRYPDAFASPGPRLYAGGLAGRRWRS